MVNILVDIVGKSSVGKDLKYNNVFMSIEEEVDKSYSVSAEESTDWENVATSCYEFLSKNSKDMKVAVWWLFANWHLDNWESLPQTLNTFNELMKKYNKTVYPKSMKARRNTILWLEDRLTKEIVDKKLFADKLSDATELSKLFEATQEILKELLDSDEKYFTKVVRHLKTFHEQKSETPKKAEEIQQTKVKTKKTQTKSIASKKKTQEEDREAVLSISNKSEALKAFSNFKKSAATLSEYYRDENPFDLKAIRIAKLLSWVNIDGVPVNKDGVTQINPPSEMTLLKIEQARENKEYEEAFRLIQSALERSPYWLDGHYQSYEILEDLNKTQEAQEIKNALIAFVQSNEGIEDLEFKNKMAFASTQTKAFINLQRQESETENLSTTNTDAVKEEVSAKVKEMIQNHQIKEATKLLQNEYGTALNYEENFKLRLELVKLNVLDEKSTTTLALISGLEKDVQRYHLDEWRPDLASEVYSLLVKYFDAQYMTEEKLNNAYEQLLKIDVSKAFNLK